MEITVGMKSSSAAEREAHHAGRDAQMGRETPKECFRNSGPPAPINPHHPSPMVRDDGSWAPTTSREAQVSHPCPTLCMGKNASVDPRNNQGFTHLTHLKQGGSLTLALKRPHLVTTNLPLLPEELHTNLDMALLLKMETPYQVQPQPPSPLFRHPCHDITVVCSSSYPGSQ